MDNVPKKMRKYLFSLELKTIKIKKEQLLIYFTQVRENPDLGLIFETEVQTPKIEARLFWDSSKGNSKLIIFSV